MQWQLGVLLVSYVADGARQIQVAIDSAFKVDCAACTVDSVSLLLHGWLVVDRERDSATALSYDTAAVASIGTYQGLAYDQKDVGCAALAFHHLNRKLVLLDLGEGGLVGMVTKSPLDG